MGDEEATNQEYKSVQSWVSNLNKGGFRAASFIYVYVFFENMAFVSNMVALVLYFYLVMHLNIPTAANTLTNFMGTTFLLSTVGGFISDTYMNRFNTCMLFGSLEVLAMGLLTIQAHYPSLLPSATTRIKGGQAVFLYCSLYLLGLGAGGVKGALPALGADQFNHKDPKEAKSLGSYFNYLLMSTTLGAMIGVTVIVWVSTTKSWWKGFFLSTVVTAIGYFGLSLGKPFFRVRAPGESSIIRIAQVIVVSFKNRKLALPESVDELYEINEKDSQYGKIPRTEQFRFLDKAAIIANDATPEPWKICTVTQVEEVKILTRMLPIIASTIIMNTCLAQLQTFSVTQGNFMHRKINKFEVPASSIPVIPLVFMSILIPLYDSFFVPFARKITKHPSGITQLQRVGVGLILSAVSMAVAALVEVKRRNQSLKDFNNPISLFWLSFQYGIFGIADMFTLVGLLEFFYKEAPTCMKSLSTSFTWISLSIGYYLSSVFVEVINKVTKKVTPSKRGWLHGEFLDYDKLDLFYWFLAILSCINFLNYLYWASWYKYKTEEPEIEPEMPAVEASGTTLPLIKEESEVMTSASGVELPVEEHPNAAEVDAPPKKDDT